MPQESSAARPGPLSGLRVVEFEAIGPAPFCGMMLADMGADVLLVERPPTHRPDGKRRRSHDIMLRGRRSITLDLKEDDGRAAAVQLVSRADALLEGFRPGVMERLGLGPEPLLALNPKLVFGRMTGWGQTGPLAPLAGHDINYIAQSGLLNAIGRKGQAPVPPLNLIGDFGGGGMLLAFGVCCALLSAQRTGRGQVVDAAMIDGASLLASMFWGKLAAGQWSEERGTNMLDGGSPWYDVYETSDGKFVSIGAIEAKFYAEFLGKIGLSGAELPDQNDRSRWPELRTRFAAAFRARSRDAWARVFEGSDACVAPVLSFGEARRDAHSLARKAFITIDGIEQPAPAPRMSRTPGTVRSAPPERGEGAREALADWGFSAAEAEALLKSA
ncbi:MAG: CoA transferase [Alphaproteobacteria bacterium]|nr:CoA transferase [Alphaproteobacteria bacterium]